MTVKWMESLIIEPQYGVCRLYVARARAKWSQMNWAAIVNQKSSKVIVLTQVYCLIYYHEIYQYRSIYHAFSTLPLHLPSDFYLYVYTIATCDNGNWYMASIKTLMHANWLTPKPLGAIFHNTWYYFTQEASLIHPYSAIELTIAAILVQLHPFTPGHLPLAASAFITAHSCLSINQ